MEFYINQEVVALRTYTWGRKTYYKEGEIYIIKALVNGFCHDNGILIHIGHCDGNSCGKCSFKTYNPTMTYFHSKFFQPLDTLVNITELTEVLNKPAFS